MNEAKDCPFCGNEAVRLEGKDLGYDYPLYGCVQPDCPCAEMPFAPLEEWNDRPIEDALNARIAELEAAQRWIPVSERLPKEETQVDLWCYEYGAKKFRAIGYIINGKWVIVGIEDQLLVSIVFISWRYPIALPEES